MRVPDTKMIQESGIIEERLEERKIKTVGMPRNVIVHHSSTSGTAKPDMEEINDNSMSSRYSGVSSLVYSGGSVTYCDPYEEADFKNHDRHVLEILGEGYMYNQIEFKIFILSFMHLVNVEDNLLHLMQLTVIFTFTLAKSSHLFHMHDDRHLSPPSGEFQKLMSLETAGLVIKEEEPGDGYYSDDMPEENAFRELLGVKDRMIDLSSLMQEFGDKKFLPLGQCEENMMTNEVDSEEVVKLEPSTPPSSPLILDPPEYPINGPVTQGYYSQPDEGIDTIEYYF